MDEARHLPVGETHSSEEEDLQPLRIPRARCRFATSFKNLLDSGKGKGIDLRPLKKRRCSSAPPYPYDEDTALFQGQSGSYKTKLMPCGAYSSKKSHGKGLPPKQLYCKSCNAVLSHHESPGESKHDLVYKGSCAFGLEEKQSMLVPIDEDFHRSDLPKAANDDKLIFSRIGYVRGDETKPKMCRIYVASKHGDESLFIKLLKEIDCENRFVARSVESSSVFYAELNKSEVAKLKGVEGIKDVLMCEKGVLLTNG